MPIIISAQKQNQGRRPLPSWAEIVEQLRQKQEQIARRIEVLEFALAMMRHTGGRR